MLSIQSLNFSYLQVINVKHSSVNMVPSKLEINLRKADQVAWGKLEDPNYKPEPEPADDPFMESNESYQPDWDIDDDDISDSDEEWAYDTPKNKKAEKDENQKKNEEEERRKLKRKEVEEEMKRALEERMKAEEERKKLEEQRRQEEEEGYEDMPELEWETSDFFVV